MKKTYIYVYFSLNLLLISLIEFYVQNSLLKIGLILIFNIIILFITERKILKTTNNIAQSFFSDFDKENKIDIPYFIDLTKESKQLCKNFSILRSNFLNSCTQTQTTLTSSLEAILNSTLDGIFVVNNDRDITITNESFFKLCGYEAFEISGKDSTRLISPQNLLSKNLIRFIGYSFENSEKNIENISTGIIEINNIKSKKTLKATAMPLKYSKEHIDGMVINLRDITKELESEDEKNKFITGISHEFKTPLFSIIGYSELILNDSNLDKSTINEFSKIIYEKSLQLSELVDNLLNIILTSKNEVFINIEKINIIEILEISLNQFKQSIDTKKLVLIKNIDKNIEFITNNKENLLVIFRNLISNSIKFSPISSEIKINMIIENKYIKITLTNKSEALSSDIKNKIFNEFFRNNENIRTIPGAGMGLFVVSKILKIHGGKINFDYNYDNKEIIFIIEIPLISKFNKEHFNLLNN